MANVKMKFSVEIEGEIIIQHQIETQADTESPIFVVVDKNGNSIYHIESVWLNKRLAFLKIYSNGILIK